MIKPKPLKHGDTIGVIAPASPCYEQDRIELGIRTLEEMGFRVKLGRSCLSRYGYLAGKDDIRAYDINTMFEDKDVHGIICLRGGYGTPKILDKIDYDLIRNNPKVYVGYSDITATHIAINQLSGLVTFHGPMVTIEMAEDFDDFSRKSLLDFIMGKENPKSLSNPNGEKIGCFYGGRCEGKLIGGNLTLICATLGTAYEIDTRGKILFLEDTKEEPYSIDRMLIQLNLAGKFEDCEGIILGDFNECIAEHPNKSLTLEQVFEDIIRTLKKPTIYNFMAGHCKPQITLPMGRKVSMNAYKGEVTLLDCATID